MRYKNTETKVEQLVGTCGTPHSPGTSVFTISTRHT